MRHKTLSDGDVGQCLSYDSTCYWIGALTALFRSRRSKVSNRRHLCECVSVSFVTALAVEHVEIIEIVRDPIRYKIKGLDPLSGTVARLV